MKKTNRLFACIVVGIGMSLFLVFPGRGLSASCGKPSFDPSIDKAVFVWKSCSAEQWSLEATAGGDASGVVYQGTLASDQSFTSVSPVKLESNDQLNTDPNPLVVDFLLNVWNAARDGFDFSYPSGSNACFDLPLPEGAQVLVGSDRVPATPPFNLDSLGACQTIAVIDDVTVLEPDLTATFTVTLSAEPEATVTIDYQTTDETATEGLDYTATSGTLTFDHLLQETSKAIGVPLWNDSESEGLETFRMVLSNAVNVTLGDDIGIGAIVDDETGPCGEPTYDRWMETGVFLWKDCSADEWHLRVLGGGSENVLSYDGRLVADQDFLNVVPQSLEGNDILDYLTDPSAIYFELNVVNAGWDGFDFTYPSGASVCFQSTAVPTGAQVHVGEGRAPYVPPFDLDSLGPCQNASGDALNFVFFLTDDQRWDTLWAMPIVQDKLVSRGVLFENAFVTTPLCCPARANVLSGGFFAHNTGILTSNPNNGGAGNFRGQDADTLATALQGTGYMTMLAGGKYLNGYKARYVPPGWSTFFNNVQGPAAGLWFDYNVVKGSSGTQPENGAVQNVSQYVTSFHRDEVLDFLDTVGPTPFFIYFSVFAPHEPAIPEAQDAGLFPGFAYRGRAYGEQDLSDKPEWVSNPNRATNVKSGSDEFHRDQLRSLQSVDRAVGAIVDKIAAMGLLDQTVFVFTSDNGFLWGEHGLYKKGMAYEESIRVPLVVVVPGITPRVDSHMVAIDLDVPPTLLALAGVSNPTDGTSLLPLLENPNTPWRTELMFQHWGNTEAAFGTWSALRTERYKYIENAKGEIELYDLLTDPFEEESQHGNPAYATVLAQLAPSLEQQRGVAFTKWKAKSGRVGQGYSYQLEAWGGDGVYTWSVSGGALPPGLSLNALTGRISGVPTQAGTFDVKVKVEDTSIARHAGVSQRDIRPIKNFHSIRIDP